MAGAAIAASAVLLTLAVLAWKVYDVFRTLPME